uniref:G domain-containing protein n=1 Tax=Chromera velia CCMP2878 TaxID=1169474 RepID=A0A0G4I0E4_9ALVE|eukprot:Cvel_34360.t1-p1 / transcript=Cvel_34360.t1 / gene=Cvel_34360 / organism=Chromera_velia_CCMP2878 / gene_product=hypothetical protein / transcript_product=hypothetical protein / location=Cvel_scaffold5871:662-2088(-) / protein_length=310 / sequence_SO=supercontig / SO=protein_coding / is_pseudo=false
MTSLSISHMIHSAVSSFLIHSTVVLNIVLVGKQHHGKSSFVNFMRRLLHLDLNMHNGAPTAPAGHSHKTVTNVMYKVDPSGEKVRILDTVALETMSASDQRKLQKSLKGDGNGLPANCAVLIVNIEEFQNAREQTEKWLEETSKVINDERNYVPYVVVATHKDCLEEGMSTHDLAVLVEALKSASNCEEVFLISNHTAGDPLDEEDAKALISLLHALHAQLTAPKIVPMKPATHEYVVQALLVVLLLLALYMAMTVKWVHDSPTWFHRMLHPGVPFGCFGLSLCSAVQLSLRTHGLSMTSPEALTEKKNR